MTNGNMDNKKRILIFSTAYFPYIGGAEVAVKEITDRLPEFEFVMVTARLDKNLPVQEKVGNIFVHRVGRGDIFDKIRLIFSGSKLALSLGEFDAVWGIMASFAGLAASRYKKKKKPVKFLLTLQEGDSRWRIYLRAIFVWPFFKRIFKRADAVQAISSYLANWAKDMGARCPVTVVPNGVALDNFFRGEVEEKIHCEHKRVITVSRLVEKNGVEDLIRAAAFLPEEVHFMIIGYGELEKKLKELVKRKGWEKRVHFLGRLEHSKIVNYLKQSDVFCRPSLSEGLGNAFLEAMAVGLPVIGTKVGGIPDFLQDGETGWYAQIKNPQDIAKKIKYILAEENKAEVDRVAQNALALVEKKYNWQIIVEKMKELF